MMLTQCLDTQAHILFAQDLKLCAWTHTLSSGAPDSRVVWTTDLTTTPLYSTMENLVRNRIPGAWQITQCRGIAQTQQQPYLTLESKPAECDTVIAQFHPCTTWNTRWHGATIIDGDRVEYEPNTLIVYDSHLPVHHEPPQTINVLRMVVEIQLERRF